MSITLHVVPCSKCGEERPIPRLRSRKGHVNTRCMECVIKAEEHTKRRVAAYDAKRKRRGRAPEPEVAELPLDDEWPDHFLDALSEVLQEAGYTEGDVFGRKFGATYKTGKWMPTVRNLLPSLAKYNIRISTVMLRAEEKMGWA